MVNDPFFQSAIKEKIGTAVDTDELEKQQDSLHTQLRQTNGTKLRLERQMDAMDVGDPYYDRKISDLQRRYDAQYEKIEEIELQIKELETQIRNIRQEKISADNIYQLLLTFDKLYDTFSQAEQKEFMKAFIDHVDIYPEKPENGCWIRNIVFNFPVPVKGEDVVEYPLENLTTVETVCLLRNRKIKPDSYVTLDLDSKEYYRIKDGEKM